jgi:hypothetical protein
MIAKNDKSLVVHTLRDAMAMISTTSFDERAICFDAVWQFASSSLCSAFRLPR